MGSSAVLRRWISRSESVGVFRSHRISVEGSADVDSDYSLFLRNSCCCRESAANRMMSSTSGVSSSESPSVPWLMLPPCIDGSGNIAYRFHCVAKKEVFSYENKISGLQLPVDIDVIKDVKFVGSSHGWLALYNRRNCDLFLSNPITDRHIKLPSLHTLGVADRVILSEKGDCLALMIFGSGASLAFCTPLRSHEWTLFGGGEGRYENLVYSRRHKRLFCIRKNRMLISLEGWDVGEGHPHRSPRLDWVIQRNKELDFDNAYFRWPARSEFKKECYQMKYLVCAQHSDDLFLVVRHVNLRAGPYGSLIDEIIFSNYRGRQFIRTPYKTVDFDVYKIDVERGKVMHMEESLEGLAMFIGINHPFAIRSSEVKPDSVYFTDENSLVEHTRLARTSYGGHDNGIFDYQNKDFSPCCTHYPIEYHKIRKVLPLPLWTHGQTPNL